MRFKKGDNVKIVKGKDRGKKGKILQVFPSQEKIVVENINLNTKNVRPKKANEKGQRVQFAAPLSVSSVMLLCNKCSKPTRIGFKVLKDKKIRVCKKCNQEI